MASKSLFGTMPAGYRRSKYGSHKVSTSTGEVFDSQLELKRNIYLKDLLAKGVIANLQRQVKFNLLPKQIIYEQRLSAAGKPLKPKERIAEYPVDYIADFVYDFIDNGTPVQIIEDTKGIPTAEYIIKRKLMRLQGHPIVEVKTPAQTIEPAKVSTAPVPEA